MLLWKKALLKKTMKFSARNSSLLSTMKADPLLATRSTMLNMTWDRKAKGESSILVKYHLESSKSRFARTKIVFITWVPGETSVKVSRSIYLNVTICSIPRVG